MDLVNRPSVLVISPTKTRAYDELQAEVFRLTRVPKNLKVDYVILESMFDPDGLNDKIKQIKKVEKLARYGVVVMVVGDNKAKPDRIVSNDVFSMYFRLAHKLKITTIVMSCKNAPQECHLMRIDDIMANPKEVRKKRWWERLI